LNTILKQKEEDLKIIGYREKKIQGDESQERILELSGAHSRRRLKVILE
jgi:hypothetical protein